MVERPTSLETLSEATHLGEWPAVPGYEICGELGQGGMGAVYQAKQLQTQRMVALKLIRAGTLASPQDRARLRIEAEAVARLQHPNIVRIYDFGEHQGQPYLVMEPINGGSLDRYLADRKLSPTAAASVARTLACAIQHSHDLKIIHRDLKPANILIRGAGEGWNDTPRSESLVADAAASADGADQAATVVRPRFSHHEEHALPFVPVITDFGLAKRLDVDSTVLTQAGAILGTASYMAPEQADGRGTEIGPAADIYALGVILYEMLAGRPPFVSDSWRETIERVIRDDPPRLSTSGSEVPGELERVCFKCLEKEPRDRYPSAAEFAADLERFLSGKSVQVPKSSARERILRRAAREGFTILAEVGHGPRSTVYQTTFGPLQQSLALKVFDRDLCPEEDWKARLDRGTPIWSSLNHPQVVMVRQAGCWDGSPYLCTDFAPQRSLAAAAGSRRYPIRTALELIEQLAVVICYLHRQGIVHGNLKPSNVLLAADGIPRVTDIRAWSGLSFGELPTGTSNWQGLAYVAPELLAEPDSEPGQLTDVYSIGAIAYELFAGRPPFVASSATELVDNIRSSTPDPLTNFNRDVSPDVVAFCQRCLQKNPWSRYTRAYSLLSRVRTLLGSIDGSTPNKTRRR